MLKVNLNFFYFILIKLFKRVISMPKASVSLLISRLLAWMSTNFCSLMLFSFFNFSISAFCSYIYFSKHLLPAKINEPKISILSTILATMPMPLTTSSPLFSHLTKSILEFMLELNFSMLSLKLSFNWAFNSIWPWFVSCERWTKLTSPDQVLAQANENGREW